MVRRTVAGMLVLVVAAAAGAGEPDDRALLAAKREIAVVREAAAVVLARVSLVHPSPGIWCGFLKTTQPVTWKVESLLHGEKVGEEVVVGHLLVHGSPLVLPDYPALRPDRFAPGTRAILFLEREGTGFAVSDETYGVRFLDPVAEASADRTAVLGAVLALPALEPYLAAVKEARRPLVVLLNEALSAPLPVRRFDLPVLFVSESTSDGRSVIRFRRFEVGAERARAEFDFAAEGVTGTVGLERSAEGWKVVGADVAER